MTAHGADPDPTAGARLAVTAAPAGPDGTVIVLRVVGEIDLSTADTLGRHLTEHLSTVGRGIVLDLTEVSFLACCGLGVLAEVADQAGRRGTALRLVATGNRPVLRPLEISGLDRTILRADDIAQAVQACSR